MQIFQVMTDLQIKLKFIVRPYLIFSLGFIGLYTFLHWLLVIQFKLFAPADIIIIKGLPVVLPWLPALLWFAPRVDVLMVNPRRRGNFAGAFFLLAAFSPIMPTIFAQQYLIKATSEITSLPSVNEIAKKAITRYYTFKSYYVDKSRVIPYYTSAVSSGKHQEWINLSAWFVCPIYVDATNIDTTAYPKAWFGVNYNQQFDNPYNEDSKQGLIKRFSEVSLHKFEAVDLQKTGYMEIMQNSGSYQVYLAAIERSRDTSLKNAFIFEGRNRAFKDRQGNTIWLFLLSLILCEGVGLSVILNAKLNEDEAAQYRDL